MGRFAVGRRSVVLSAVLAIVPGLLAAGPVGQGVAAAQAGRGQQSDWVDELEGWDDELAVELGPMEQPRSARLPEQRRTEPADVAFPEPMSYEVPLTDGSGDSAAPDVPAEAPVDVQVPEQAAEARSGGARGTAQALQVEVLDRAAAARVGASGFVFRVSGADGAPVADAAAPGGGQGGGRGVLPAQIAIDYSGFERAYGGGYADRLQVVALPECALAEPRPEGCAASGVRLQARNLGGENRLVVDVPDLVALDGGGLAVGQSGSPVGAVDETAGRTAPVPDGQPVPEESEGLEEPGESEGSARPEDSEEPGEPGQSPESEGTEPSTSSTTAAHEADQAGPTGAQRQSFGADAGSKRSGAVDTAAGSAAAPSASGSVVLAVVSSPTGETGDSAATPLSMTGSWSVSPGSGDFSYSYPIDVPEPAGGSAPTVGLGYSSGAVDGMTSGTNPQAGQAGLGWGDFANAFIERSYEPCVSAISPNRPIPSTDLCWRGHNGTISLNGVTGNLIPLDTQFRQWRVQNDPGWRIERIGTPGAPEVPGVSAGEHWKVTAEDGTQYFFGLDFDPDTAGRTRGYWDVPVFADHLNEPCYDTVWCSMAWRWNLDRVVDPDGNVTTYHYGRESNRYKPLNNPAHSALVTYIRSGWLDRIEYGRRSGTDSAPTARVSFGVQNRCVWQSDDCPDVNLDPTPEPDANVWPDTPVDLVCNGHMTACPNVHAPSFFSGKRYSHVKTEVWDPTRSGWSTSWKPVTQYNLYYDWSTNFGTGIDSRQLLMRVVPVGLSQEPQGSFGVIHPETSFGYTNGLLDNRVDYDTANPRTRMKMHRVTSVTNPYGGVTRVTYGQQRPCPRTYTPPVDFNLQPRWDRNVSDCFPQTVNDTGVPHAGVFHKWLTREVTEDPKHGSEVIKTTYTYENDPAWGFDTGSFERYDYLWGFRTWRGYGTVTITKGTTGSHVQKTQLRLYRGMHGDIELQWDGARLVPTGTRNVQISTLDNTPAGDDHLVLAGRTLEQRSLGTLGGQPDHPLQSTVYTYVRRDTETPLPGYRFRPQWAAVSDTLEKVWSGPGAFRQRGGHTEYNARFQPISAEEKGWLDVSTDNRCTLTTYAENAALWMWNYPASNRVVAGACNSTVEVSASQTLYDGSTVVGTAPTRGNPTKQRTRVESTVWAETNTLYDALGRPTEVTNPVGAITRTSFTASPWWAIPTATTVTNALNHATTATLLPDFQVPLREEDPNGNVTTYVYDAFGRRTAVRLPTEQSLTGAETRSWQFAYHVDPNRTAAPKVQARQLTSVSGSTARHEETWTVYDAMMRERQVQTLSPATGKTVVSTTAYNNVGLVAEEMAPEAVSGTPTGSNGIMSPAGGAAYQNRTRFSHDALGRTTREVWLRGTTETARVTTHAYSPDQVTATGPEGAQVRETVDGLGRTVKVEEYAGGTSWAASNYVYDAADNLLSVTDAEGQQTTYQYNLAGWRRAQQDPHRGLGQYDYDLAGNRTRAVAGNGEVLHTSYDPLGRPKERRAGSPTGTVLASWSYDATGEKGLLNSSTRHTPSGTWVTDVTGYDDRNRSLGTTLSVPAGIPGISGRSYTVTQDHDRADRAVKTTYPAVGGLSAEDVTTSYNALGLPESLTGTSPYVRGVTYDDRGRRTNTVLGPPTSSGGVWMATSASYDQDQQLATLDSASASITSGTLTTVASHGLTYDDAGHITERTTTLHTGGSWRECYSYDVRNRMTQVKTLGIAQACNTGGLLTTFNYSAGNRVTQQNRLGVVSNYTYPAAGQARPYAPVQVGNVAYEWDANGNLTERTEGGAAETFDWDTEQRLASVTDADGTSSFVYDAEGQRLLRQTPDGATLYFAGHEVTATSSSNVTAVRSYSFAGAIVATRTPGGVDYLVTDDRGSVELAAPSGQAPATFRAYEPYGRVGVHNGDQFDTDRGFLSQVEDDSMGLSYLNARYYDTVTTQFTAPDPVYDTEKIKSLNPYTYAHGNPVAMSDASGTNPVLMHQQAIQIGLLKWENAHLRAHIGYLNGKIDELQGIIREQNDTINQLLGVVGALEATIRQQQSIIEQLADRVVELERQVAYWKSQAYYWYRQAQYWKAQAAYWKGQAMYWKGQAMYWKGQAMYWRGQAFYWRGQADYWKGRAAGVIAGLPGLPRLGQGVQLSGGAAAGGPRGPILGWGNPLGGIEWNPVDDIVGQAQDAWNSTRGAREAVGGWVQRNGSIEGLNNVNYEFTDWWQQTRCNQWAQIGGDVVGLPFGPVYGFIGIMNQISCALYGY